jgi:hypothetical protein
MPQATYVTNLAVGGVAIQPPPIVRTGDHPNPYEVVLAAGKAGTLTTRTDNDTGVITVPGHTLQVGDNVDVYWSVAPAGRRYGMKVSSIAGNDVTVGTLAGEIGAGDNFPAQGSAVVITKQVVINTAIDGDKIQIIGVMLECPLDTAAVGHISFFDVGPAQIHHLDLAHNDPTIIDVAGGATNPFTGNPIVSAAATSGSSTQSATLKIASLEDSTP